MSNIYYDQIMALNGLSGFKDVIERWQRFSDNINRFHARQELVVPDLLWVSDNGIDRTGLLKLLAGFLEASENLVDFYGNVKYFEYYLEYIPEKKDFHEIEKIAEKIRDAAGFRSEYRGILSIELDEWVGHFYEDNFINTMKYLSSMEDDIVFVFHIRNYNSESVEQLMQLLVLFFRIEVIEMKLPDSEELGAYIKNEISSFCCVSYVFLLLNMSVCAFRTSGRHVYASPKKKNVPNLGVRKGTFSFLVRACAALYLT